MPGENDALSQHASASPMPPGVTDPNYRPPPGRLGNLTVPQQHALDKFREQLQEKGIFVPERMDDATLLRFLRARQFDLTKTMAMFESCEQWRKDFKVDELSKNFDYPERDSVIKVYPQYYHKTDIDGRPLWIEQLGKLDIKVLFEITTHERQIQRLVYEYEKLLQVRFPICSATVGHPVETCTTILDLKGAGLTSFYKVKDFVMQAASVGQDRYPETMGRFFIINAPWAFSTIWAVTKPWLDPVTVAKIDIIGSDYKPKLLAQIPAENLPTEFGGTCECSGGCAFSDAGPWNPPSAT